MGKTALLGILLAAMLPLSAAASPQLTVNGKAVLCDVPPFAVEGTTYVSLRSVAEAMVPKARVTWEKGRGVVTTDKVTFCAKPGDRYITANGDAVPVPHGVKTAQGRVLVPVRVLADALGGTVAWDGKTGTVAIAAPPPEPEKLDPDAVYWLSRIISAESCGEPMEGKIAVGNVVLNRVASPLFPNTIYGVIFEQSYGGQFEPVRNGTIYRAPTVESVAAAERCLRGENVAGKSLYFLAPALTNNHWMMENRPFVMTIGAHWFYE